MTLVEIAFDGREQLSIDGLRPGSYHAFVENDGSSTKLATAKADIRAGERTVVDLHAPAPPSSAKAMLRGTLVIPEEYDVSGWVLEVGYERSLSVPAQMKRDPASPETWSWTAGELPTGTYLLRLEPLGCAIEIELGEWGRDDVQIVAPPPGLVSVDVVERDSLRSVVIDGLRWSGPFSSADNRVTADPVTGRFEFRAPCGEIEIIAISTEYRGSRWGVQVGPGRTETTLEVSRFTYLTIELRDAHTKVPWEDTWDLRAEPIDGGRPARHSGDVNHNPRLYFDRAGRYRLHVGPIPGFQPVPVTEIDIVLGESIDHVIHLERKQ